MKIKDLFGKLDFVPGKEQMANLKKDAEWIKSILEKKFRQSKIKAEVFVGGSFAKDTLIKSKEYDIDIFVRFDKKHAHISAVLHVIVEKIAKEHKLQAEKLHGSRDYMRLWKDNVMFEIIPVRKIKKPSEAENVTDLSYFHVNYTKKKLKNAKLKKEVVLAKQFCKAQRVYGAESYVNGFSGYALECLIIHYKSLEKMLKEAAKAKEQIVIDPEKHYKNKGEVMIGLNASKVKSPIVLVDPTWKERNVLAALNNESFEKFREAAKEFLKKPSTSFFEVKKVDKNSLKEEANKNKAEFVEILLETDRQAGDIAGTKLKKFANFIAREAGIYFEIVEKEFDYSGKKTASFYLIVKPKNEVERKGPPVSMKDSANKFKEANRKAKITERMGILYAKMKVTFSAKEFIADFKKKYAQKIKEMDIVGLKQLG